MESSTNKVAMNVENKKNLHFLYCKHFDIKFMNGDITFHLCSEINKIVRWQVMGSQKIRGVWCIAVWSEAALATLLDSSITVNDTHIKRYSENPYARQRGVDTESIVVKDFPMWEDDSHIINYFKSLSSLELHSDDISVSKARNTITNNISSFENGDKFVYVKSGFHTLPERAVIASYLVCLETESM